MKLNKLLASQINTSIHARGGRSIKLKFTRYQLADDILLKTNFHNQLWLQYIQVDAIKYMYFPKTTSPVENYAIPSHPMTIKHLSKLGIMK